MQTFWLAFTEALTALLIAVFVMKFWTQRLSFCLCALAEQNKRADADFYTKW